MTDSHRIRHVLLVIAGAIGLVVVGALAGAVVLLSGVFTTAATKQHFLLTHRLLDVGLKYSVREHSENITAPSLEQPAMVERGLSCYQRYCVQCHGAPGVSPGPAARGLLPVPANLVQSAREWPATWLYYVTRKGVRMTGMPAWEFRLSEKSLWSTVAFLKTLPSLTREDYLARASAIDYDCELHTGVPDPPAVSGEVLLLQYACHSCHVIEGVVGPPSHAGPPLVDWSRRGFIAGVLPNTRENLARWIHAPQEVSPYTLMPDLGVPPAHARVMAAFLFSPE